MVAKRCNAGLEDESDLHAEFSHRRTCDREQVARLGSIRERLAALAKLPTNACLTPDEAAALLRTCTGQIRALVEEGALRAIDVSSGNNITTRRCLRIPAEALANFIKAREIAE